MIAFSLWWIHVYRYGIMYFVSFLIWYVLLSYGQKQWWYRGTAADDVIGKDLDGFILSLLIGVMIWWRLWHVFIYDRSYFVAHPLKILAFQEWGMSFIGGIIGVVVSVMIYFFYLSPVKNSKNKNVLAMFDAMIPIVPLGIFFWRFGNFLNQELYGRVVSEAFRGSWLWQLMEQLHLLYIYDKIGPELRFNTNVLSMIFEWGMIALVLWILFFKKVLTKKRSSWQLSMVFLGLYSGVRFMLEYVRQDSQAEFVGRFTKSQWFFVIFFVVAVVGFVSIRSREVKK